MSCDVGEATEGSENELRPSPIIEPKPMDRSRSNSISRILLQISQAGFFIVFPLPLKLRVVHMRKIKKIDFVKNGSNDFD